MIRGSPSVSRIKRCDKSQVFKKAGLQCCAKPVRQFSKRIWRLRLWPPLSFAGLVRRSGVHALSPQAVSGTLSLIFGWRAKSPFSPEDADPTGLLRYSTCCYISYILLSVYLQKNLHRIHLFVLLLREDRCDVCAIRSSI